MDCSDTNKIEAVRLEHVHLPEMKKLNHIIGILKRMLRGGNARITLTLSGGRIDIESMEPCQVIKLLPDDLPPKTVA